MNTTKLDQLVSDYETSYKNYEAAREALLKHRAEHEAVIVAIDNVLRLDKTSKKKIPPSISIDPLSLNAIVKDTVDYIKDCGNNGRGGDFIRAIKYYRELTGLGLKEAKDAVEQIYRDHNFDRGV